jgi:hypothetical protein
MGEVPKGIPIVTIRPIPVPPRCPVAAAWVVNDKYYVYLEGNDTGYSGLAFAPIEKGIGGRLIEPSFINRTDYVNRTKMFRGLTFGMDGDDVVDIIEKWAAKMGLS